MLARACAATVMAVAGLTACGGGGDSGSGASADAAGATGAATLTSDSRSRALAAGNAAVDVVATADGGWTALADENQRFNVQGTQTVRYGSGSNWITRSATGAGECSNDFFGGDPIYGTVKHCELASGWSRIANEGEGFNVASAQSVRYGAGNAWLVKTVTGAGQCTNAFFGNDPIYGTAKQCEVIGASTPPPAESGWTRVATEGQNFSVTGTQTVRYGSGSNWLTRSVTTSGQCSNGFFGNDPIYGVAKECQVAAGAVVAAGVCTPPIAAVDTANVAPSVGNGTPGSCTEAALRSAIAGHDVVTFNCGAAPVTISVASQIDLPTQRDIVIDGGGKVTLDGGNRTRILSMIRLDYRTNRHGLTLQHIALQNGKAAGTGYVAQDPNSPQCAWGYATGAGGAIELRDARLHVIDVDFRNNATATPGPDIGGGAIYASGSLDVTIVGSRFSGNSGSNGGAVGLLQTNGQFVNSVFDGNASNGVAYHGPKNDYSACRGVAYPGQGGGGGNGGAIVVDGSDDTDLLVCGSRFSNNQASDIGGALARTPNISPRRTTIDRSVFQGNRARQAGALFVLNSAPLEILASTFSNNTAVTVGAAQIEGGRLNVVNTTFAGNQATQGVGGALLLGNLEAQSSIRNVTFANNQSSGGTNYFSAAIFGQVNFAIDNTVFANNVTNDPWSPMQCNFAASGSNDVQWPLNHIVGGGGDSPCVQGIRFADPLLAALGENGGPTPTLLPASSSPLRGAGRNCPATDQRGQPRNPGQCTIGAVE